MKLKVLSFVVALVPATAAHAKAGCHTLKCKHRVAHRMAREKKLRVIRPERWWLGKVGACESGTSSYNLHVGLRAYNPGGPFYNRYQFSMRTWWATGARVGPMTADWLEQAYRAVIWKHRIGNPHQPAGWPVCG